MTSSGWVTKNTTNKYKDGQGRWLTAGLFKETSMSPNIKPLYTLDQARRMYLEEADPTEYQFAQRLLESWEHWKILLECNWFKPIVEAWREELDVKLRSESIIMLVDTAKAGGREGAAAAKWVAERGWNPKSAPTRGRPSKGDVEKVARLEAEMQGRVDAHLEMVNKRNIM